MIKKLDVVFASVLNDSRSEVLYRIEESYKYKNIDLLICLDFYSKVGISYVRNYSEYYIYDHVKEENIMISKGPRNITSTGEIKFISINVRSGRDKAAMLNFIKDRSNDENILIRFDYYTIKSGCSEYINSEYYYYRNEDKEFLKFSESTALGSLNKSSGEFEKTNISDLIINKIKESQFNFVLGMSIDRQSFEDVIRNICEEINND